MLLRAIPVLSQWLMNYPDCNIMPSKTKLPFISSPYYGLIGSKRSAGKTNWRTLLSLKKNHVQISKTQSDEINGDSRSTDVLPDFNEDNLGPTVSVFCVGRLHLNRVMHLKHGQMMFTGQQGDSQPPVHHSQSGQHVAGGTSLEGS